MKKKVIELLKHKNKTVPILSFPSTQLLGISVNELISSAEMQLRGMKAIAERFSVGASLNMMDLSVEAEAFGAKIRFYDDDIPAVETILEKMHPEASCALVHQDRFQLLAAVVLSAQTTDKSVNKVTPQLFGRYPDPESLAAADVHDVEDIIRTIGLYKNKAASLIRLSGKLLSDFGGEVPGTYEDLVSLPGVGRKTANVVLAEGFGVPRIAVDTHVFRVARRIGLASGKDVTEVEEMLMQRIPRDHWIRMHHLLIFHGRKCCSSRQPKCTECGLAEHCSYFNQLL